MAGSSLRDRLATRRAAQALLSPVGLGAALVAAVAAVAAGAPPWGGAVAGVAVWAANVLRLLPRSPRRERIDPFTVPEPWRRPVQDALRARARFAATVDRAPTGPLRDRLREIADRVDDAVDQAWSVAKRGETLAEARRAIDVAALDRQVDDLRSAPPEDARAASVLQAVAAQRATADRLDRVVSAARSELEVLHARLDEAVARTVELTARARVDATGLAGVGSDVDAVVAEMEALRLALDEADVAGGAAIGPGAGDGPGTVGGSGAGDRPGPSGRSSPPGAPA
ncbi:MAG TPA: hypothetical protein VFW63_01380 [Acidimicrobiales bacterium]|nr:hypothetical protein [Acidimicrobiales bacterium]